MKHLSSSIIAVSSPNNFSFKSRDQIKPSTENLVLMSAKFLFNLCAKKLMLNPMKAFPSKENLLFNKVSFSTFSVLWSLACRLFVVS